MDTQNDPRFLFILACSLSAGAAPMRRYCSIYGVKQNFFFQPDWIALALVAAAALALWRLKWRVIHVVGAAALAGLLLHQYGLR